MRRLCGAILDIALAGESLYAAEGPHLTDAAVMTIRLRTLAVQNGGRGLGAFALGFPDQSAQRVVEGRQVMVQGPLAENMVNRFPRWEVGGQIAPRDAALNDTRDGVQDAPSVGGRTSTLGKFGEGARDKDSPVGHR